MYCWQKQQGRSRVSPEHSQPHERMMVDYLQEMSYAGPPESQDSTLALQSYTAEDDDRSPALWENKVQMAWGDPLYTTTELLCLKLKAIRHSSQWHQCRVSPRPLASTLSGTEFLTCWPFVRSVS
ncbi:hypothetical protein PFLUV_G00202060 [Perca fluviatilis]|uniref:Uncharacterized protein n=1 Tax=Perca fluviatilis TaxID=8168 RepID=A0A6A5E9Y7_PERFL|nr:hypothetical protein PFLUV_G00202060 [Perca fluviatilis]